MGVSSASLASSPRSAQVLRDSRIAPIYEGTNGIQALDLVTRKVQRDQGATMRAMIAEARAAHPGLQAAADALERATATVCAAPEAEAAAGATAYLEAAGWVLGCARLAQAAALDEGYAPLRDFALARLLPRAWAACAEVEKPGELLALMA